MNVDRRGISIRKSQSNRDVMARRDGGMRACETGRRIKIQWPTATENIDGRKEVTIVSIQGWPIERPSKSAAMRRGGGGGGGEGERGDGGRKREILLSQGTPVTEC